MKIYGCMHWRILLDTFHAGRVMDRFVCVAVLDFVADVSGFICGFFGRLYGCWVALEGLWM